MPFPLMAIVGAALLGAWALERGGTGAAPQSPGPGSAPPNDPGSDDTPPAPSDNGSGQGDNVPQGRWYSAYVSSEYHDQIQGAESDNGIPQWLYARILWQESRYDPNAKSPDGQDRGIAQINAKAHPDVSDADAFNPDFAIPWGAKFLASLYASHGDWYSAVMAYNGTGPAAVAYADSITADVPV